MYAKDPCESKHQWIINRRVEIKELKNTKTFIDYSQTVEGVYENVEDYNPTKKRKVSTVFDDMKPDTEASKKLSPIVTELFLRERKLVISLVFILQSYFKVPKTRHFTCFYITILFQST